MKGLPLRLKFWSISLYNHCFSRYKVIKNWKFTELPQTELDHLTVKVLYIHSINTYPGGRNFGPFCSMTSRFRDTRLLKIGYALNDPTELEHLNHQKYPAYTKDLPQRTKFWSILLYNQRFSKYKVDKNWKCTKK